MTKKLFPIMILIITIILSGCSQADNYYKDGIKCFQSGDYEAAADYLGKAIAANPNRAQYYIDYGLSLTALGKYKDAVAQFDRAYINKDMSFIRKNNKRALRGKGIAYYRMQNYENAVDEFKAALKIDELPELSMDILYYMGSSYREEAKYQEAQDVYTKLLKDDQDNASVYGDRAYCYQCMGEYKKSLEDYDKAISLKPDDFRYYFGKYNLLTAQGEEAAAIKVLQKAADIKAVSDEDNYNLAKLHYYQKDYDTALPELEESLKLGFSEADYYIGEIYRINKDYTKAIYYYENYIKTGNIPVPNVYNQIAVCQMKTGDYEKALEYLETGITYQSAGSMQFLLKNEIIAYEKLGDFNTADEKLKSYLDAYPDDKNASREADFMDTRRMDAVIP